MRHNTPSRAKYNRDAQPARLEYAAERGKCALCGWSGDGLSVHEMCNGAERKAALIVPANWLVLCYATCHLQQVQNWPLAKQCALKLRADPRRFNLRAITELETFAIPVGRKSEEWLANWLTLAEVEAFLPEVDEAMRIQRSKAGTWGR